MAPTPTTTGPPPTGRLLRFCDLAALISYGRTRLWALTEEAGFPRPVQVSPGTPLVWERHEVEAWLDSRPRVAPAERAGPERRRRGVAPGAGCKAPATLTVGPAARAGASRRCRARPAAGGSPKAAAMPAGWTAGRAGAGRRARGR